MFRPIKAIVFITLLLFHFDLVASESFAKLSKNLFEEIRSNTYHIMNLREKRISRNIEIRITDIPLIMRVGAYREKGNRVIDISTGHTYLLNELAIATATTTILNNKKVTRAFEKYIKYLAYSTLFNPQHIKNFKDFAKIQEMPSGERYDNSVMGLRINLFAIVLFHEIAHHVYGHVDNLTKSAAASRSMESEADSWAIRKVLKAGFIPQASLPLFMLMSELNEKEIKNEKSMRHPASLRRAVKFVKFGIEYLKTEEAKRIYSDPKLNNGISHDKAIAVTKDSYHKLKGLLRKKESAKTMTPDKLYRKALRGDRKAMLKVGEFYDSGKNGFPFAPETATIWYCKAADAYNLEYDYDIVERADAQYRCGHNLAFRKGVKHNYKKAKEYLSRSAKEGYIAAIRTLETLIKNK